MNNLDKFKEQLTVENARMILADVKKPTRCYFCIKADKPCGADNKAECNRNIQKWLERGA